MTPSGLAPVEAHAHGAWLAVRAAGRTGAATALQLATSGDDVRVVTRRGTGPVHPRIELVAADASNAAALTSLAQGSATLINCAAYHRWPEETPALSAALLAAAEQTGAGYINLSNICGYGPVDGLLTDDLPLRPTTIKGRVRAQMYLDGLESRRVRHRPGGRSRAESRPPHPCSGPATRSPQATRRHRSSPTTSKPCFASSPRTSAVRPES